MIDMTNIYLKTQEMQNASTIEREKMYRKELEEVTARLDKYFEIENCYEITPKMILDWAEDLTFYKTLTGYMYVRKFKEDTIV